MLQKTIDRLRPAAAKATLCFHALFFLYVCLGFNNLTVGTPAISVVMWPTYLLGAALLVWRALDLKTYRRMPGLFALAAMCAACGISMLINRQYSPKQNAVHLIFWLFYFFLLYLNGTDQTPEDAEKRFTLFFHAFSAVAFILTAISFGMLIAGYSDQFLRGGDLVRRGYLGGRLFGAYQTPNAGAVIGALTIAGSVHYIRIYRNRLYTAAAVVNCAAQFVYMVLSDSRSGRVCLGLALGVYLFFTLFRFREQERGRRLLAVCLSAAVAVGAFYLPKWTQMGYNAVVRATEQNSPADSDAPGEDDPEDLLIGRKESLEGDYSNRRLDFWKSGVEIFLQKPLFGLTFKGFLPYAEEHMPDTYLVNNDYMKLNTLDNDVLNLAVSCGVAGLLPFAAFVFAVLRRLLKTLRQAAAPDPLFPLLLAVCAGTAAVSLLGSGVLYMQCQYSFLFWLALGALMNPADDSVNR